MLLRVYLSNVQLSILFPRLDHFLHRGLDHGFNMCFSEISKARPQAPKVCRWSRALLSISPPQFVNLVVQLAISPNLNPESGWVPIREFVPLGIKGSLIA